MVAGACFCICISFAQKAPTCSAPACMLEPITYWLVRPIHTAGITCILIGTGHQPDPAHRYSGDVRYDTHTASRFVVCWPCPRHIHYVSFFTSRRTHTRTRAPALTHTYTYHTVSGASVRRGPRGGGQGGLAPPPSPQKIAPPNSQARIQGGAKRALPPPPRGAKRALAPPLQNPGSAYVCGVCLTDYDDQIIRICNFPPLASPSFPPLDISHLG